MNHVHQVKTTNGGSYIDGVPALQWGQWKDCTLSCAISTLLNSLGMDASYEQVAGLTGSCYRFGMCYGWDPGSLIVNTSYAYLGFDSACGTADNAGRAFGLDFSAVGNAAERDDKVRQSIGAGVPVLCMGGYGAPEWCVITGYDVKDGISRYFGRSYFDDGAKEDELVTGNRYTVFSGYPGEWPEGFLTLCDRTCQPLNPLEALKVSLETCIRMFSPHPKMGYGAYEFMIHSLETDPMETHGSWNICMHFVALMDARKAAAIYLEESAALLSGGNASRLMQAAAMYRAMFDALSSVISYENMNMKQFDAGLPAGLKKDLVDALQRMVSLERQARVTVQAILDAWQA